VEERPDDDREHDRAPADVQHQVDPHTGIGHRDVALCRSAMAYGTTATGPTAADAAATASRQRSCFQTPQERRPEQQQADGERVAEADTRGPSS
jgi:hypothetical protein